jgi:hypothetical protein
VVIHNIYCERGSGQQETSGRSLKGFRQINNNYDVQNTIINNYDNKTQSLIIKITLNTKHRKNIGADRNYWRRQNSRIDKISAWTKSQGQQNLGVDKMLAQMQKNPLTVWLGIVHNC